MSPTTEIWEFLLLPIYFLVPIGLAYVVPSENERRLFLFGISAKILGVLGFVVVYLFYYGGGDTTAYFKVSSALHNLILLNPSHGFEALLSPYSQEIYSYFTSDTGFPYPYICRAQSTYIVAKVACIFSFPGLNSFILTSILLASFTFLPVWYFYQVVRQIIPTNHWAIITCALFVPSVLFWGGGISKDSITYASLLVSITGVYSLLIKRQISIIRIAATVIGIWFLIVIKPYIFLVFFPSALIWVYFKQINKIKNDLLRLAAVPLTIVFLVLGVSLIFSTFSEFFGAYSSENIIEKAIISQEDLKRDYYGGNYFDIGEITPTTIGVLSKFPIATFWGFFGPTLLNINSPIMLFSAIETTILLFLSISIFILRNPLDTLKRLQKESFLSFCLVFSVAFAFGIGLSSPNFGALVRFKIPLLPLFSLMLCTVYFKLKTYD